MRGGRLALLAFEAAKLQLDLGGQAAGGAVEVAAVARGVEDGARRGDALGAGGVAPGHAAALLVAAGVMSCDAVMP